MQKSLQSNIRASKHQRQIIVLLSQAEISFEFIGQYICAISTSFQGPSWNHWDQKQRLTVGWFLSQVCEYPDGTKSLKLGDFGLATVVEGPLYTVCGTPTYVAPEIIAETGWDPWWLGLAPFFGGKGIFGASSCVFTWLPRRWREGETAYLHHDCDLGNLSLCFYIQEPWAWAGTFVPRLVLGTWQCPQGCN